MQGAKVLVVDDSTSVRKVLEKLLSTRGLVVTTSESAEQGLEAVSHNTPHLVIADVVMPGMSGFELCQILKMRESTKGVPVILISGIINEGVVAQAQQAGAFDVVSKPFTPDDLFPKIERALSAAKQASPTTGEPSPAPSPAATPVFTAASTPTPIPPTPAPSEPVPIAVSQAEPPTLPQAAPVPTPPVPSMPANTEPPHQALMEGLRPFLDKPEIESVLVISNTGQLLSWAGQTIEEPDLLATYLHTMLSISSVMGEKYHLSSIQSLGLEYLGKTVMVNRISDKASLVLLLRGTGGTGVIRYLVLKQMPQLKAVLGE
ncbi:response regulator [Meiothermus hypogaeus]|uniref:Transcriptional regulator n=2 Tax=Meiothermus hypogaeus TaxID=884155 RepID=A0A511R4Y7_9DEIN|nr:response regulator [Meiothermus hypogaeus]RIH75095.1 Nitrogen regulation protein NR(I) [Meiothermus hypogaeus]GEM84669.1 transcriptional regulator [Meiothermus hypogaeus NBRC 106114]